MAEALARSSGSAVPAVRPRCHPRATFEVQRRGYPAAVVDYHADPSGAVQLATHWAAERAVELSTGVRVWVVTKPVAADAVVAMMVKRLRAAVVSARSPSYSGDRRVVVAVCATSDELLQHDARGAHPVCVLSHQEKDTRAWRRRRDAVVLDSRVEYLDPPAWDLHAVVVAALTSVEHVVATYSGLGGIDGQRAASALRVVHDNGFRLPREDVLGWALERDWSPETARGLADLADRIEHGEHPRTGSPPVFSRDDLTRWGGETARTSRRVTGASRAW